MSACYTGRGVLEWVGRSLAPLTRGERKVRTPQGSELDNDQAGRPDDKCNREQTSRWPGGVSRRAQVMGETVVGCKALNVRDHQHGWRQPVARQTLRGARPNRETSSGLPARCAPVSRTIDCFGNGFGRGARQFPGRSLERQSNLPPR